MTATESGKRTGCIVVPGHDPRIRWPQLQRRHLFATGISVFVVVVDDDDASAFVARSLLRLMHCSIVGSSRPRFGNLTHLRLDVGSLGPPHLRTRPQLLVLIVKLQKCQS